MDGISGKSALKVNEGVDQPPIVNPNAVQHIRRNKQQLLTTDKYVKGICEGSITVLSKAITLIESSLFEHQELAQEIIEKCLPYTGNSVRLGITGVPGAGKSTFIETFGRLLTSKGHKVAVLAIDPSSERSKGSILGDKTRMVTLSGDPNAFIRPSPSAGSLGGVARKTRETVILCEAAGFDVVIIETVGVGQSETAVHSMVDFFLLLMIAGAGDELQGIKRGIMEMADLLVVNKADGSNVTKAMQARTQYQGALHLFPPRESGWEPKAMMCSSIEKTGLPDIWTAIEGYVKLSKGNRFFYNLRQEQTKYWMYETIDEALKHNFYSSTKIQPYLTEFEHKVMNEKISSFAAAKELLNRYFKNE
ncbi:MAG: methylmalonyl Co-A mutase-associated GTPase MeaB [Prevotellaceae bacterium]|nr:methylmalonyl Co-A mutase-associated GTPase MeaB [Prevotellaceae bacterium]